MREKARLDSFRRPLKNWLTHTGTLSGKQCLSVSVSEQIPRANLNTSSQIKRPALQTEFSVLKHSQTFRIWDWALHDIFPKSRLVMVAESSGRRSMRNSAPLSQTFAAVLTEWNESVEAFQHNWFITLWQRTGLRAVVTGSDLTVCGPYNRDHSDPETLLKLYAGAILLGDCFFKLTNVSATN